MDDQFNKYFLEKYIKKYLSQLPIDKIKIINSEIKKSKNIFSHTYVIVYKLGDPKKFSKWRQTYHGEKNTTYFHIIQKVYLNILRVLNSYTEDPSDRVSYINIEQEILRIEMLKDVYDKIKTQMLKDKLSNLVDNAK